MIARSRRQAEKALHDLGRHEAAAGVYRAALRQPPENAETLTRSGNALAECGRFDEAEDAWRAALRLRPDDPQLHSNLGIALRRQGRLAEAVASYRDAIRLQPDFPEAYNNLGNALCEQQRPNEAIAAFRHALRLRPTYAEAHDNLGAALLAANDASGAVACFERAVEIRSDFAEAWVNLASALQQQGNAAAAEAACRRAIAVNPRLAIAHTRLGEVLAAQGDLSGSIAAYRRVVELAPALAETHCNLGAALLGAKVPVEAAACFNRALEIRPDFPAALINLGIAVFEQGQIENAIEAYDRAIALAPNLAAAHSNRGNAFYRQDRFSEALASYDRALAIQPDYAPGLSNRGNMLVALGRHEEALASYAKALTLRPDDADCRSNRALLLLLLGRFSEGWREYDYRRKRRTWVPPPVDGEQWRGEDLRGKRLLIYDEQGFGDTLQFCRYAPLAAARGRVAVAVRPPLARLLGSLAGIEQVVTEGDTLPPFDFCCSLLSLPQIFDTTLDTIPAQVPYLAADPAQVTEWRQRLAGLPGLRVGLVWAGSPTLGVATGNAVDRRRSIALADFGRFAALAGVSFVSLQKGEPAAQTQWPPPGLVVHDWTDELEDFADTAALIEALDLVISVDTSVVHLAGALGKPVWILNRFDGDWRWLVGRKDSPWYPSARLFRQTRPGDWDEVLRRVTMELATLANRGAEPASPALDAPSALQSASSAYQRADLGEAERLCRAVIAADPGCSDAHNLLAVIAADGGRHEDALAGFERVLALKPDDPPALSNRGNSLHQLRRYEEALASFDRALALRPDFAEALSNRGSTLHEMLRYDAALASHDKALSLRPDYAPALSNRGLVLCDMRRYEEALASYDRALAINPQYADCQFNRALLLLLLGCYADGWRQYEWRLKTGQVTLPPLLQPRWAGEALGERTLLLVHEQGFGDTLQFCRYATLAAAKGRVIIGVPRPLARLLGSLEGVAQVVAEGDKLPPFDVYCPIVSLPLMFGTALETIPANVPYLAAERTEVATWQHRLAGLPGLRVGLVWAGNPRLDQPGAHAIDRRRSMSLADFGRFAELSGISFVSLQKGEPAAQSQSPPPGLVVHDWTDQLDDFADTAALIEALDLVISVDTSVVHLAGALGKPVWILSRYDGCWRWLRDREDSPWYPSARLFRQTRPGDWDEVLQCVTAELARFANRETGSVPPAPDTPAMIEGALAAYRRGDLAAAARLGRAVTAADPNCFDAHHLLAAIDAQNGLHEAALAGYDRALAIRPDDREALSNRSVTLDQLGRHQEALASLDRLLARHPDFAEAWSNRGNALRGLGRHDDALASFDRALSHSPDLPAALLNRGATLHEMRRCEEALASYDCALAIQPDYPPGLLNRGTVLHEMRRYAEALANYDKALAIQPDFADCQFNRAQLLLLLGQFAEGWRAYEWRLKTSHAGMIPLSQPRWAGEPLGERTLLLVYEQGFGDTLQFCRYATLAAARGRVIIGVPRPLARLLGSLDGVAQVVAEGDMLPPFDVHCPLLSLPLMFGTTLETIPATVPYLAADPAQVAAWRHRLAELPGLRVGLVWAGSARPGQPEANAIDRRRSMSLADFGRLAELTGVSFVSLQKGEPAAQAQSPPPGLVLHDWTDELEDFADTAALIEALDLVISVDTSVVHLAGALGKPVWVLSRYDGCWRWLLDRDDSPWYPSARLFRQTRPGDWAEVLQRVTAELATFAHRGTDPVPPAADTPAMVQSALSAFKRGDITEAERFCRAVIAADPNSFDAHHLLAAIDSQNGRHEAALAGYDRALALRPDDPQALSNRSVSLDELKRYEEALADCDRALSLLPGDPPALSNRGNALRGLGRHAEALVCYDRALALRPDFPEALSSRGSMLHDIQRSAEALASFDRALAIRPDYTVALSNRGIVLKDLQRHAEAMASFDKALAIRPDFADCRVSRAMLLLLLGRLAEGWPEYEWRLKTGQVPLPPFPQLRWAGEELGGRTLLLVYEQGFGDTLQFCRYATLAAASGRVIIAAPRPLARLLGGLEGVAQVVSEGDPLPPFDFYSTLLSLPLVFGTTLETIPAKVPYLAADPAQVAAWRRRLGGLPGLHVGLVWAGNPRLGQPEANAIDRRRSMSLADFGPFAALTEVSFVSLQKGEPAAQALAPPAGLVLHDWTDELGDFADTAALIEALDLVISVDTSVVHLAGALGKPVWVLSRYDGCWRWLLDREDSPWYPSARLFRQTRPGDWGEVVGRLAAELLRLSEHT